MAEQPITTRDEFEEEYSKGIGDTLPSAATGPGPVGSRSSSRVRLQASVRRRGRPAPAATACSNASGSTPALTPSVKPSARMERKPMPIMLWTSLAISPQPMLPT